MPANNALNFHGPKIALPSAMPDATPLSRTLRGAIIALIAAFVFSVAGCAPKAEKPHTNNWRRANIHKVLVVCVQKDPETSRRAESHVAPILRRQGFDAVTGETLFARTSKHSPDDFLDRMRLQGVDGIMEFTFSGDIPREGLPRGIRFKFHSAKNLPRKLSDRGEPFHSALLSLMAGIAR